MFDRRGEDKTGDRIAVGQKGLNQGLEVGETGCRHFQKKVITAGEVMAFADFFQRLNVFEEAVVILASATHADEREDFEPERFAVNFESITAQDTGFFHLLEPLAGGGGREANAPAKLSETKARIGLQFVQKLSTVRIEQRRGIHGHNG